jgi:hypothetical protein
MFTEAGRKDCDFERNGDLERNVTWKGSDFERNATLAFVEPAENEIRADRDDQPGADATARLLFALTALYVQRSNHTVEEQQQYTELALRLIDKVEPAACAAIAAKLRRHPDAPAVVMARLDEALPPDGPAGASSHSAQDQHGERQPLQHRLAEDHLPETDPHHENQPFPGVTDRERVQGEVAPAARPSVPPTSERAEAFFAAAPPERRRMLSEIAAMDAAAAASDNGRRFHVRIDTAPWQGRTGAFACDFARLIDAPKSLGERILNDPSGEPLVVAARATGMPAAMLQRILLLVCPATNHSVQRVYDLTELYHDLDAATARALLAAWRDAAGPDGETLPPAAPVTNLRARLGALNARIESAGRRPEQPKA